MVAFPEISASRHKYAVKITAHLGLSSEASPWESRWFSQVQLASGQPAKPRIVWDSSSHL